MTIKHNGDIECHINDLDAHIEALRHLGRLPPKQKTALRQKRMSAKGEPRTKHKSSTLSLVFMLIMGIAMMTMIHQGQVVHTPSVGFIK